MAETKNGEKGEEGDLLICYTKNQFKTSNKNVKYFTQSAHTPELCLLFCVSY